MHMTSRELVHRTLEFTGPERVPRQLWTLPWAETHHGQMLRKIQEDFPDDIINSPGFLNIPSPISGDPFTIGEYTDEWGCRFRNIQSGLIGEVKEPLIKDEDWLDDDRVRIPEELLSVDTGLVNEFCRHTDKFVLAGACPRPFEQLQFIRGTEHLYVDLLLQPERMLAFIRKMHDFYCRQLTLWAGTDVDALSIMDDWGAQNSLLIDPSLWCELFKPMYKDYIDIAHAHGKKIFMHSDGYTLQIIPHLIDIGLDALNSQLFCIGLKDLAQFKGTLTFWGEIDRQQLLPHGTLKEIEEAVRQVKETLWNDGGCIAQCEFGPAGNPANVYKVFETWDHLLTP
jgi:hypothetical protein